MGTLGSSNVWLRPMYVPGKDTIGPRDMGGVRRAANIRQLKRTLRDQIPHMFTPEVLQLLEPSAEPMICGFEDDDYEMGETYWNEWEIKKAVVQMVGRALGKSHVGLDDVKAVLLRMDIIKKKGKKPGKTRQMEKSETWAEKIERVKMEGAECVWEEGLVDNIVNPDNIDCTFDDVIIDPATKDHLRHLIALSTSSASFKPIATSRFLQQQLRLNGTLHYGPPGTGKTHLSRAIANSSSANFIPLDTAAIQRKYVGESEKSIKAAFTLTAKLHPCVMFFDEVDALFYRRASDDKSWQRSVLAQFLTEMDGLNKNDKVPFVVVATNRPQDMDEAFYRRLPNKVYFKFPREARRQILKGMVSGDLDDSVTFEVLARQMVGYSGSDLKNLCAEAALIWVVERVKEREAAQEKKKKHEVEMKDDLIEGEKTGDGKDDKDEAEGVKEEEVKEERVKLTVAHFAKALKKVRPSVSPVKEKGLQDFMKRFDPGSS